MKVDLELTGEGIKFTSDFNTGSGKWINIDGEYVQVLVLAVDDKPLWHPDKTHVHVTLKTLNPLELV